MSEGEKSEDRGHIKVGWLVGGKERRNPEKGEAMWAFREEKEWGR